MGLRQHDEGLSHSKRPQMLERLIQEFRRIPIWLRVVGGAVLVILACGVIIGFLFVWGLTSWASTTNPSPYVEGGPGTSARLSNGGAHLFTFPDSTANIESSCSVWQETLIRVWFEMDADELDPFLDSMRWDVRPLTPTDNPPTFGDPYPDASYLYGEYADSSESLSVGVWIDASSTPYRVFISILYE